MLDGVERVFDSLLALHRKLSRKISDFISAAAQLLLGPATACIDDVQLFQFVRMLTDCLLI